MISDSALESIRDLIGKPYTVPIRDFCNTEASRDNLQHYAIGAGDLNPLWHEPAYAGASPWKGITAMPTWLASVVRPAYAPGKARPAGCAAVDGMVRWDFAAPVRLNDQFTIESTIVGVERKTSRSLGEAALTSGMLEYYNADRELLARTTNSVWHYEKQQAVSRAAQKLQPVEPTPPDQVVSVEDSLSAVVRRGATPRYWDDVQVGDEITSRQRPTLTQAEIIQWMIGNHGMTWWQSMRRRMDGIVEDEWIRAVPARHIDPAVARADGIPSSFDIGVQRVAWLAETVSNWMGDYGVLRALTCQFRRLIFVGDTPRCGGHVTNKEIIQSDHVVDLELFVRNQRDEVMSPGSARVCLPIKPSRPSPAP